MVQSSATKAENLENEFTEVTAKVQELCWKEGKSYPGAGWNRMRTKAREVSRGGVSLRGGPGCLKLPLCIQGCSLWSEVKAIWISVNEDLHGSEMHVILFREASKTEVGIETEVEGRELVDFVCWTSVRVGCCAPVGHPLSMVPQIKSMTQGEL